MPIQGQTTGLKFLKIDNPFQDRRDEYFKQQAILKDKIEDRKIYKKQRDIQNKQLLANIAANKATKLHQSEMFKEQIRGNKATEDYQTLTKKEQSKQNEWEREQQRTQYDIDTEARALAAQKKHYFDTTIPQDDVATGRRILDEDFLENNGKEGEAVDTLSTGFSKFFDTEELKNQEKLKALRKEYGMTIPDKYLTADKKYLNPEDENKYFNFLQTNLKNKEKKKNLTVEKFLKTDVTDVPALFDSKNKVSEYLKTSFALPSSLTDRIKITEKEKTKVDNEIPKFVLTKDEKQKTKKTTNLEQFKINRNKYQIEKKKLAEQLDSDLMNKFKTSRFFKDEMKKTPDRKMTLTEAEAKATKIASQYKEGAQRNKVYNDLMNQWNTPVFTNQELLANRKQEHAELKHEDNYELNVAKFEAARAVNIERNKIAWSKIKNRGSGESWISAAEKSGLNPDNWNKLKLLERKAKNANLNFAEVITTVNNDGGVFWDGTFTDEGLLEDIDKHISNISK